MPTSANTPLAVRNFYGSLRVRQSSRYPGATVRTLTNGTIQHGTQIFSPELRKTPTTYYAEDSGVGLALRFCCQGRARNIGVIGLGVGTIAAYGQPGDRIRFYEINPAVTPIAQNRLHLYSRIGRAGQHRGRRRAHSHLPREAPQHFDVLVVDAFSGDAIPLHLLTTAGHRRSTSATSRPAASSPSTFPISMSIWSRRSPCSRKAAGMKAMRVIELIRMTSAASSPPPGCCSPTTPLLRAARSRGASSDRPLKSRSVHLWTDDYSSLLPLLRW